MLAVAYTKSMAAALVCLSFAVGIGGFAWAGFSVNHLDIAPQVCIAIYVGDVGIIIIIININSPFNWF